MNNEHWTIGADFNWEKISEYKAVRTVPLKECGEELVLLQGLKSDLICKYGRPDMLQYTGENMYLRKGVVNKLLFALAELKSRMPDATLKVVSAWRHPELQEKYFNKKYNELKDANPNASHDELLRLSNMFYASLDVAGHPAGASVDLTIIKLDGELDMGTSLGDFSDPELVNTFCPRVRPEQLANRMLLRELMFAQHFAPFNGEWWHFSYGDREWAAFYQRPYAIYGHSSCPA